MYLTDVLTYRPSISMCRYRFSNRPFLFQISAKVDHLDRTTLDRFVGKSHRLGRCWRCKNWREFAELRRSLRTSGGRCQARGSADRVRPRRSIPRTYWSRVVDDHESLRHRERLNFTWSERDKRQLSLPPISERRCQPLAFLPRRYLCLLL